MSTARKDLSTSATALVGQGILSLSQALKSRKA
nr:MAG TPA: hypothetical protein [Caudoviricetes sp.]